jgi:arginyl-tRNA synthetase
MILLLPIKNLGVDFDKYYYESNTYLLGKDVVK